jgi:hypothetical protein
VNHFVPLQVISDSIDFRTYWCIFLAKKRSKRRKRRGEGEVLRRRERGNKKKQRKQKKRLDTLPYVIFERKRNNIANRGSRNKYILWGNCKGIPIRPRKN